jgi:DNA topoisomerase I
MQAVVENLVKEEQFLPEDINDAVKTALSAGLVYVTDSQPGYIRVRNGDSFYYLDGKKKLHDKEELKRIKSLVLPPAWENVWICKLNNGHLQATGLDKLQRKQYRYHPSWMNIRNQTKFYRLKDFGERLPMIRKKLEKDLSLPGFPQNKVLAAMVSLLERINIRVGNSFYERLYGSFGLTTLKNRHVKVNGSQLQLTFRGKKGVRQNITFTSKKLSRIIKGCKEIPGKELFEYYDENKNIHPVDSGMVNNYIRAVSDGDFTAKDFRTWAGSIHAILAFKELGDFETISEMNRKIPAALDKVAEQLGNTRAVCKKYYVHPLILEYYRDKKLESFIGELNRVESGNIGDGYMPEEKVLLKILENYSLPG